MQSLRFFILFLFTNTLLADVVINEIHYDPATGLAGDANGDGVRHAQEDEFIEIVNMSFSHSVDISGWQLGDDEDLFVFPVMTILAPRQAAVLFGDYSGSGSFDGTLVFDGDLIGGGGLNNSGEPVQLLDDMSNLIDSFTYSSGDINQSITRSPELTGSYVTHTTAEAGVLFSPGTAANGLAFSAIPEPSSLALAAILFFTICLIGKKTKMNT